MAHGSRIVLLTRGHGYGHAARDLLLVEHLRRTRPEIEVEIASSGTGLDFYRRRGVPCVDLEIPDEEDTTEKAGRAVHRYLTGKPRPDLVVSDEVMWALPVCRRVIDVPCVVITDWFYNEFGLPAYDAMFNHAAAVIVPDLAAAHPDTAAVTVPIHFTGPMVRDMRGDRTDARRELGLPPTDGVFVAVVTLGGMTDRPETRAILRATLEAWDRHAAPADQLIVLSDELPDLDAPRPAGLRWAGVTDRPEVPFAAADVVIADGPGFTVCELSSIGARTLAIRPESIADGGRLRLDALEEAGFIVTAPAGLTPGEMWSAITAARDLRADPRGPGWAGPEAVAALLLEHLRPVSEAVTG